MNTTTTLTLATLALLPACASSGAGTFATPEEAVQRLIDSGLDEEAADELLGPGGFDVLSSGDPVADREDLDAVRAMASEQTAFEDVGPGCKIALLGKDGWELPIPLVLDDDGRWVFDVEAGREEVLNRRVGRNELLTIATLRQLVDAQREYASVGRDGRPPAFAQRWASSEGAHDGLYWPVEEGEARSPLGPLVAEAAEQGYRKTEEGPQPFHGYYYRMLTAQGARAPGGARSYLDEQGLMTRGFAVVSWPATYGNSGVMTFQVNHRGIVFQKDLGEDTAELVEAISAFDPDPSWDPTSD